MNIKVELNMNDRDYYNSALSGLQYLSVMLYGGYYEPKSNRDLELARELHALLQQHKIQSKE